MTSQVDVQFEDGPVWVVTSSADQSESPSRARTWMAAVVVAGILALAGGLIADVVRSSDGWVPVGESENADASNLGVDEDRRPTYIEEFISYRAAFESHVAEFETHLAVFEAHLVEFETRVASSSERDGGLPSHLVDFEARHLVDFEVGPFGIPAWSSVDVQIDRSGISRSEQRKGDQHGQWISRDAGIALGG